MIQLVFLALVLEKDLHYHGLAMCVNSANDASISCENFVKFGPVTSKFIQLILNVRYDTAKKQAYLVEYLRIYWTDFEYLYSPAHAGSNK